MMSGTPSRSTTSMKLSSAQYRMAGFSSGNTLKVLKKHSQKAEVLEGLELDDEVESPDA